MEDGRIQLISSQVPMDFYGQKPQRFEKKRYCVECGGRLGPYNGGKTHRNFAHCKRTLAENDGKKKPRPVEEVPAEAQLAE